MMMPTITINENILNRFSRLRKNGRLAHAYLFIGPHDSGKTQTALAIAKLLNCEKLTSEKFCDTCPSCAKINHGHHPDIHTITRVEDSDTIKIEQIRQLISVMQLRPFEAKQKIVIIRNIEYLTIEGGNALLKTLEEPSANSLLILTTANPEKNLDTIRSRCHAVYFFPAAQSVLAKTLHRDYAMDESTAHFLAHFSEGCLGRARALDDSKFLKRKNEVIDAMILSPASDEYLKKVLADKDKTKELLTVLLWWFKDLFLIKSGVPENWLAHWDRRAELQKRQKQYSRRQIQEIIDELVKALNLLQENLNLKVPVALLKEKLWRA